MHEGNERRERRRGGFTLIEVLAVVVILGILAGVVINRAWIAVIRARVAKAKVHISQLSGAVQEFHMDVGRYPTSLQDLITQPGDASGWRQYLETLPKDPWKTPYQYKCPGTDRKPYEIVCYGADRQEGGEGEFDKDISCWTMNEQDDE